MKKRALLLAAAFLLAACQPAAVAQPTPLAPTPMQPPAATATPSAIESPIGSVNELIGVWWFSPPGVKIEFTADGTYRVSYQGTIIDEGGYNFDAGKVVLGGAGGGCHAKPATYEAYVTRQDGKPLWLRMQIIGSDSCIDRGKLLTSKGKPLNP